MLSFKRSFCKMCYLERSPSDFVVEEMGKEGKVKNGKVIAKWWNQFQERLEKRKSKCVTLYSSDSNKYIDLCSMHLNTIILEMEKPDE